MQSASIDWMHGEAQATYILDRMSLRDVRQLVCQDG